MKIQEPNLLNWIYNMKIDKKITKLQKTRPSCLRPIFIVLKFFQVQLYYIEFLSICFQIWLHALRN